MYVLIFLALGVVRILCAQPIYIGTELKNEFPSVISDINMRVTGAPYINSNSFRSIANWRLDFTDEPIDPEKVEKGDIIYINTVLLGKFFELVEPFIKVPFILLVHDADTENNFSQSPWLDQKNIVLIGCVNSCTNDHPKVIPLPLGIPNGVALGYAKKSEYESVIGLNLKKLFFCTSNFRDFCHARRKYANSILGHKPFITQLPESSTETYIYNLASSEFCISPRGAGMDCYRHWEALLLNCIPVVETSFLDPLFHKLPVLIIDDYAHLTEAQLVDFSAFVHNNRNEFIMEKIYFKYWADFFLHLQNLIRLDIDYHYFIKEFKRKSFGI